MGEGVDEATTENIFIEGDNLEVLKLLHKSYRGRVKMIYIDPPYNTGNDFIYKDDYREPLESYLQRSGQMTDLGELLSSNPKSSGRFHSNWLNMLYPRLRVAKDLLREDGVIFVSIDDTEVLNLRQVMNEIFGEENFVANIVWEKKYAKQNDATWFSTSHDHILLFARNKELWRPNKLERDAEQLKGYTNPDADPRGDWQSVVYTCNKTRLERPNLYYPIIHPKTGKEIFPDETRVWGCDINKTLQNIKENRLWWGKDLDKDKPRLKVFLNEVGTGVVPDTLWLRSDAGDNQDAKKAILELFQVSVFDTPKPTKLIRKMLEIATSSNSKDIILDFFTGSATTGHAVFEQNKKDSGKRKFICVQLPEGTPLNSDARKAGFKTISEISKERIRRAIKKIKSEQNGISPLLQQAGGGEAKQDLGFKVFRLERSNFRAWTDFTGQELADFRPLLEAAESPFVAEAGDDAVLNEILLLEGFPLNSRVEQDSRFERNRVFRVTSPFSEHRLFITLDTEVWEETIDRADQLDRNDIFICLDNSLSDENKVRLADVCRLKTI